MLFPTPLPSPADERVLHEIDVMRARMRHQVLGTPSAWVHGLRQFLTADAVAASNQIEGFQVSTADVRDLTDGERDVDVSAENREETLAHQRMMTYIQTLHDVTDFAFSKGLLNALHWMLQGHRHTPGKPAGQWRRGAVRVTDALDASVATYTAPDVAEVPGLMDELIDWLNDTGDVHPLVRAAMAHLHLVSIHPWADGNGRMSRSLQTLLIAREGVLAPEYSSIEAWLRRSGNTWQYYRELSSLGPVYRPDQDVSSWIRFNLTAYHQQAQVVQQRWERSAAVWGLLAAQFGAAQFSGGAGGERVVAALHDVAMTGRIRRARYEQAEGLTRQQAQRDLRDLVVGRVLRPVGKTRARYYIAGPAFPEQALEVMSGPMSLVDPYG